MILKYTDCVVGKIPEMGADPVPSVRQAPGSRACSQQHLQAHDENSVLVYFAIGHQLGFKDKTFAQIVHKLVEIKLRLLKRQGVKTTNPPPSKEVKNRRIEKENKRTMTKTDGR